MKRACLAGTVIIATAGAFAQPQPRAKTTHARDRAVIDRLLASSPTNSTTVRAGDIVFCAGVMCRLRAIGWLRMGRDRISVWRWCCALVPAPAWFPMYLMPACPPCIKKHSFDAATDWAMFANVSFVARTSQADYVYVQEGTNGDNSAGVGKLGGQQALTVSAWTRNGICHEIGHTLGLVHEHQRSDRDSFVTIQSQNIQPGLEFAFAILPNSNNRGAYDFLSVMHYARNAFATSIRASTPSCRRRALLNTST